MRLVAAIPPLAALLAGPPAPRAEPVRVAVLHFDNNTGRADYDPLGKGIAAMLVSDLDAVEEIRLLERSRIEDVVAELRAQQSALFDSSTAVTAGRLAGAEYVVVGSIAAREPQLRIDTRVVQVETGAIVKTAKATGREDRFFDVQQQLAQDLIDGLGLALSPEARARLAERQEQNRLDDLATVEQISSAMAAYDAEDYVEAVDRLLPVMRTAPTSSLVKALYDDIKDRTLAREKAKAKDAINTKVREGIRGLLRKP
jgi:TolB-like protein